MARAGFLLAEDEAIKKALNNLHVYDDRDVARPVQVFSVTQKVKPNVRTLSSLLK